MLAMVVVLMRLAGRPESWAWFNVLSQQEQSEQPRTTPDEIDTRQASVERSSDAPDVMRIGATFDAPSEDASETLPGLRRDEFAGVADDTVLRGGDEHAAFFRTFEVLRGLDEQSPTLPRPRDVGFVQLFRQPEAYRGEWIRVSGTVRRALPIATPANDHQVDKLYQLWLQPEGRPDDLLAIDVLQLPPGFPTGEAVKAPVTVDGVFFKRWAYHAGDGIRTVPLILARTVAWTPEVAPVVAAPAFGPFEIGLSALSVAALIGFVIWLARSGRRRNVPDVAFNVRQLAAKDHGNDVARMLADLRMREEQSVPSDREHTAKEWDA
jgi:hypothetical protein